MRSPLRSPLSSAIRRPMEAGRRGGSSPPGDWVPIQQVPGWNLQYAAPLGQGITDDGEKWTGVDHAITGFDPSLFLLYFNVSAATMPVEGFPMRIRVPSWSDTIQTPGVNLAAPTGIQVNGVQFFPNGEPPTTEYAGQPFEFTCIPVASPDGQQSFSQVGVGIMPPNVQDDGGSTLAIEFRWEIQSQSGEWQLVQDAPGVFIDDWSNLTNTGTTFSAAALPYSTSYIYLRYNENDVEREIIPQRITILNFVVTPSGAGVINTPSILYFDNSAGLERTDFNGPTDYPPTSFPGGPFQVNQIAKVQPYVPPSSYSFGIVAAEAAYENAADTGQVVNFEIAIEVQLPP